MHHCGIGLRLQHRVILLCGVSLAAGNPRVCLSQCAPGVRKFCVDCEGRLVLRERFG